ncbi:AI-2E family transporter [Candidatus Halobonum tyrrellensis]|uniref:Permease n=1 Tax=Candidatus Halobonum tyrrellensis G22 TaxID=1324957 RepID=V4IWG3_9EURY|nr:AI-2E family transporter [Candidatus Halobonum tyrrellensis]ESP87527.1 permease [Candidatus Halobonum tyrrellensis G22]
MSIPVDTEFDRSRVAWWLVVALLAAVVAYVLYAFVGVFLLGLFVYYATRPIYRQIARRSSSPTLTAAGALVAIALPILLLMGYTVLVGVDQLQGLLADSPAYVEFLQPYLGETVITSDLGSLVSSLPSQLSEVSAGSVSSVVGAAASYVSALAAGLIYLFVVLALAFFLLRDDQRAAAWFRSLVGRDSTAHAYATAVDRDLQTLYFGNILTAFAIAIVAAITYNAVDLVAPASIAFPAATLLGLLTGVGSLIPVVGIKVVYVPIGLYLGVQAALDDPALLWFPVLFLVVAFVVVDTVPELVLRPYISGRGLHVGMVMFAYILGPVLFGWYGLFLAPLLLVLVVQAARLVLPDLVRGGEVSPATRDTAGLPSDETPGAPPAADDGAPEVGENPAASDAADSVDSSDSATPADSSDPVDSPREGSTGDAAGSRGDDRTDPVDGGTDADRSDDERRGRE